MKVIFLDFDGVLNSADWYKRRIEMGMEKPTSMFKRGVQELDNAKVRMVSDFVLETNASVVVSSSWRILRPIEELRDIVSQCGWEAPPFIDITPRSEKGFRGDEVRDWLNDNTKRNVEILEPITHFVIFDDDRDFHSDQPLVKTSWDWGIELNHIVLAREILLK